MVAGQTCSAHLEPPDWEPHLCPSGRTSCPVGCPEAAVTNHHTRGNRNVLSLRALQPEVRNGGVMCPEEAQGGGSFLPPPAGAGGRPGGGPGGTPGIIPSCALWPRHHEAVSPVSLLSVCYKDTLCLGPTLIQGPLTLGSLQPQRPRFQVSSHSVALGGCECGGWIQPRAALGGMGKWPLPGPSSSCPSSPPPPSCGMH